MPLSTSLRIALEEPASGTWRGYAAGIIPATQLLLWASPAPELNKPRSNRTTASAILGLALSLRGTMWEVTP
jgi:hypothetical protein